MVAKLDVGWGVDKTGAISACLWGDVAEDICCIWRGVHESRERGQGNAKTDGQAMISCMASAC